MTQQLNTQTILAPRALHESGLGNFPAYGQGETPRAGSKWSTMKKRFREIAPAITLSGGLLDHGTGLDQRPRTPRFVPRQHEFDVE